MTHFKNAVQTRSVEATKEPTKTPRARGINELIHLLLLAPACFDDDSNLIQPLLPHLPLLQFKCDIQVRGLSSKSHRCHPCVLFTPIVGARKSSALALKLHLEPEAFKPCKLLTTKWALRFYLSLRSPIFKLDLQPRAFKSSSVGQIGHSNIIT